MTAHVVRQDKARKNERWFLEIGDDFVTLTDSYGRALLQWTPVDISHGVQFPSFSQSIKYPAFKLPDGTTLEFDIDSVMLKALRTFANRGIASQGPRAIRVILRNAILTCIGGLFMFVVGSAIAFITFNEMISAKTGSNERSRPVGFMTAIIGFGVTCRGIYGLWHYAQLKKLSLPAEAERKL